MWNRSCPMPSISFLLPDEFNSCCLSFRNFELREPLETSWNSLVTRCKNRDSEELRVDLVSSLVKGRLPSHLPFRFLSNVAGLPPHQRNGLMQKEAIIISSNHQHSHTKLPSLHHPGISRHIGWDESKRTEKQMDISPKKRPWWNSDTINLKK